MVLLLSGFSTKVCDGNLVHVPINTFWKNKHFCYIAELICDEKENGPFATNDQMVQNPPCWKASSLLFPHWDIKTKRPQPVKHDWPLFQCPSAGIIMSFPSSMADFV